MATADRALAVLGLFSMERPSWTVDEATKALGLSSSTAYQYFRSLVDAGLLAGGPAGRYSIGPAIIAYDRITRRHDPLIHEARGPMRQLVEAIDADAVGLLCRSYRLQVICVDQFSVRPPSFAISYERGRPMPLVRGAASKVILASLPPRVLRRFFDAQGPEVRAAGLGEDWEAFRQNMRLIRKAGALVTHSQLDVGRTGISAPVSGNDGVVGSIGIVVSSTGASQRPDWLEAARGSVRAAAEEVSRRLRGSAPQGAAD